MQRQLGFISTLAAARAQNRILRPGLGIRVRVGVESGKDGDNDRTDDIQTHAEPDNAKSKNEGRRNSVGEENRDTQTQSRCTQEVRIEISIARKLGRAVECLVCGRCRCRLRLLPTCRTHVCLVAIAGERNFERSIKLTSPLH